MKCDVFSSPGQLPFSFPTIFAVDMTPVGPANEFKEVQR